MVMAQAGQPGDFDPLQYAEDFRYAWAAAPADVHALLVDAMRRVVEDGAAAGGRPCCGGRETWHRPWCTAGPVKYRQCPM
jgi:hypothetical protein